MNSKLKEYNFSPTLKKQRFSLIEEALNKIIEPLLEITQGQALGFSQDDLDTYTQLQAKTKSQYEYLNFLANKMIEIYKTQTDTEFWAEYDKLLQEQDSFEYRPKFEKTHVDNAIQNAFYFYFGLYAALPKTYFERFRKELDQETFKVLVKKSQAFSKAMSIIHFDMFRSFIYSSSQTKVGVATKLHNFMPDTFAISDDLDISLSPEALARAKAHTQKLMSENRADIGKEKPTIGCPAKFVKVDSDKDLIDLIFHWVEAVMSSYFFDSVHQQTA